MRESLRALVKEMVRHDIPFDVAKREFERLFVEEVISAHKGNQSAAARSLGIHRNTLSKKLDDFLANRPGVRAAS
ncbi:MAG: helix-turn-helix domain-containing protein [Acidobacteria bacterium]|nr:helix-turn-helix domain-containing protein [Acidobacteriota bacterium]